MSNSQNPIYEYQVGGSLQVNASTYVQRQADQDLYEGLKRGEFCYVLNSRQMGKSSLRVRTMARLQAEGIACVAIQTTDILEQEEMTPELWYAGVINSIVTDLGLYNTFDDAEWWTSRGHLSPVHRFSKFIREVLLEKISQNIVIFIDEIDRFLSLKFNLDSFFSVIRECYNKRADVPAYFRLTFALIGVATPSDLIQDKLSTPFNIGRAINLTGFQFEEALSLAQGLAQKTSVPQLLLREILAWTGGQPFLTQKLCQIVLNAEVSVPIGSEVEWIKKVVQTQVIENWEFYDQPEHLKTIRERILSNQTLKSRLLGIYQQILLTGEIVADNSPEMMQLQLSGLVVKRQQKLSICNKIYECIFDLDWVEQQLRNFRPYAEKFTAWEASSHNPSYLLNRQELWSAQTWAVGKSLSDKDHQFLAASVELDKRDIQIALDIEKKARWTLSEANQTLIKAQQKAQWTMRFGISALATISLMTMGLLSFSVREAHIIEIEALNSLSKANFASNQQLEALIASVKAGKQIEKTFGVPANIELVTVNALGQLVNEIQEHNRLEKHNAGVVSVSYSPDGKLLASASLDKTIKLWSRDGRLLKKLTGHSDVISSISFSPDSKTIASTSVDKTIKIWRVHDGSLLRTITVNSQTAATFSPDGTAIASANADQTIKIWNASDGRLLRTLKGHNDEVICVSYSPDGKIIASGSKDQTIKLWSSDGHLLKTLIGHNHWINSIAFSPDGQTIVSGSRDKTVKLWSSRDGHLITSLNGHSDSVLAVAFSPDGRTIASASVDNTVKLWSYKGVELETFKGHIGQVSDVSFSPDSRTIASASLDGTIRLWQQPSRILARYGAGANSATFSPDGSAIAPGSLDGTIRLWLRERTPLNNWLAHKSDVYNVAFSPDGQTIASANADKTVKLWRRSDGTLLHTLIGHTEEVNKVSFSPDGKIIATAGKDNIVKLWHTSSGTWIRDLKGHSAQVYAVSFSPDGQILASASADNTIKLWNSSTGGLLRTIKAHNQWILGVTFSPDGKMIASSSADRTVKLWQSSDGQLLQTFLGHTDIVYSSSFSPDGKEIASASEDKTVKIWSLDGRLLKTFKTYRNAVRSVGFSADGKTIISGSSGIVRSWHFDPQELKTPKLNSLINSACDWLHDYLNNNDNVMSHDKELCQ